MDTPLQKRAGFNQGAQTPSLTKMRHLGQPGIKITQADTVIFTNSPAVPGESNPRTMGFNPTAVMGAILNRNGVGVVDYDLLLRDPSGYEFPLIESNSVGDGFDENLIPDDFGGNIIFVPLNWSIVLRVTAGSLGGQGVFVWPWAHDLTQNVILIHQPVSTSVLEIGPPVGRGWELMGNVYGQVTYPYGAIAYYNFEPAGGQDRSISSEILRLAGEDIDVNAAVPLAVTAEKAEQAFPQLLSKVKTIILAYPDKLKVTAGENATGAPTYLMSAFAEFDLPKDMG